MDPRNSSSSSSLRGKAKKPALTYLDVQTVEGVDTPAIIIHSALSSPGEDMEKLDKGYSPFSNVTAAESTPQGSCSSSVLSGSSQINESGEITSGDVTDPREPIHSTYAGRVAAAAATANGSVPSSTCRMWDEESTSSEPLIAPGSKEASPEDFRTRVSSVSTCGRGSPARHLHLQKSAAPGVACIPRLAPVAHSISKSYNDLSSRHCGQGSPSNRSPVSGRMYRKASHHRPQHHHSDMGQKNQLLPATRKTFHGVHSMRSRSADDVRERSGTDEYVWKDGKVQLKNGGIGHGESVRYVWKDGHVEKITTDVNNSDTQVEILESSDNTTCKRINPIFACVFLVGVIAVVIVVPVYYMT